jgi:hypothetical protein
MWVWRCDLKTGKPLPAFDVLSKTAKAEGDPPVVKLPLFRWMHSMNGLEWGIDSGKLSAFWEGLRGCMWPNWKLVEDVREPGDETNEDDEPYLMPKTVTVGPSIDLPKGKVTSERSITFMDIPYNVDVFKGSFCYDKTKGKSLPINDGNVAALVQLFKLQAVNGDTSGIKGDSAKPRRIWIPFSAGWNRAETKEIEEYEKTLSTMKSWVDHLVNWEFVEVGN